MEGKNACNVTIYGKCIILGGGGGRCFFLVDECNASAQADFEGENDGFAFDTMPNIERK